MYKETETKECYVHGDGEYCLTYNLTKAQNEASEFILSYIKENKSCVLNAVTGAGKTEIIYETIKYCVKNNKKIGIVIPRKDVVIELLNRIKKDFINSSVVGVYGGSTSNLYADIIILTSHQLFRYNKYFDTVIIDEVDAFPFYGNEILNNFLKRSVKGSIVYMSATINKELLNTKCPKYFLNRRFHGVKLDIPKVKLWWSNRTIYRFIKENVNSIILIYFPTIKMQLKFSKRFKLKHYLINSKVKNRDELLSTFHNLESGIILSTLVLERGVTFKNVNVIVYRADHQLFTYENLVQISGRVGRKMEYPTGKILFLADKKTKTIKKSIGFIKKCNE